MAKKRPVGRPPGPYGNYIPEHLKRENVNIRLPAWLKNRISGRKESATVYIERLILTDTGWKEPKK